jgi:hypothetical protein
MDTYLQGLRTRLGQGTFKPHRLGPQHLDLLIVIIVRCPLEGVTAILLSLCSAGAAESSARDLES